MGGTTAAQHENVQVCSSGPPSCHAFWPCASPVPILRESAQLQAGPPPQNRSACGQGCSCAQGVLVHRRARPSTSWRAGCSRPPSGAMRQVPCLASWPASRAPPACCEAGHVQASLRGKPQRRASSGMGLDVTHGQGPSLAAAAASRRLQGTCARSSTARWPARDRPLPAQAQMRTRALKQRINDLRRERLVFNDLLRKLAVSLQTSRANVVQALKSVHHANLARDRVRHPMPALTRGSRLQHGSAPLSGCEPGTLPACQGTLPACQRRAHPAGAQTRAGHLVTLPSSSSRAAACRRWPSWGS